MGQVCCSPGAEDAEVNTITTPAGQRAVASPQNSPMQKGGSPAARLGAGGNAGAASGGLTFDLVLSDLEKAEQLAYGSVFTAFAPSGAGGRVGIDSAPLRDFVATNTCVPYTELDVVLLTAASASEDILLSQDDFLKLMRENAIAEGLVLERFLGLSADGSEVASADCRTGLFMMKDDLGATANAVGDGRWDAVFDSVMRSAGATVSMESWTTFCKQVARIARVTQAANL